LTIVFLEAEAASFLIQLWLRYNDLQKDFIDYHAVQQCYESYIVLWWTCSVLELVHCCFLDDEFLSEKQWMKPSHGSFTLILGLLKEHLANKNHSTNPERIF